MMLEPGVDFGGIAEPGIHFNFSSILGSGALAGSTFAIDRTFLARELGFSQVTPNSLDAVSDRDFLLETLGSLSILMMQLSR